MCLASEFSQFHQQDSGYFSPVHHQPLDGKKKLLHTDSQSEHLFGRYEVSSEKEVVMIPLFFPNILVSSPRLCALA